MAKTPVFCVVILTAPPAGQLGEGGGSLVKVDGKESLLRCTELFVNREGVGQMLVVVDAGAAEGMKGRFGSHFAFAGVKTVIGGPRWLDQVAAALPKLGAEVTHVIVHDGARPIVPVADIDALFDAAIGGAMGGAAAVALVAPSRATLLELDDAGRPTAYHLPDRFVQLLTPQAFVRAEFERLAATKVETDPRLVTVLAGSPLNMRIGSSADERAARANLAMLPKPPAKLGGAFEEAQW